MTGAVTAIPLAQAAQDYGKPAVMAGGNACFLLCALLFSLLPDTALGTVVVMVPFCILFGIGRGVWENTNKAVIADFYSGEASSNNSNSSNNSSSNSNSNSNNNSNSNSSSNSNNNSNNNSNSNSNSSSRVEGAEGVSSHATTAFSTIAFFSGYSSAVGYFTFYALPRSDIATIMLLCSIVSARATPRLVAKARL
jgi:hypothetical protein